MKRMAVIDIGTNSIKFCVGEKAQDGTLKVLKDANDIARLGEGLRETGMISPEALERNAKSVADFAKQAKEMAAEKILVVGTMALRTAKNTKDFVSAVEKLCGLTVEVLPGEEEARLAYLAVLSALPIKNAEVVIFDTGGGSTEFIFGRGKELIKRFSVNLGAVAITENHFSDDPVKAGSVEAALSYIKKVFDEASVDGRPKQLVGMGGTVTSMGAVKHKMTSYDPDIIQGSTLTLEDVEAQIADYKARTLEERRQIPGLQPKRADVILAGACILKDILTRFGVKQLVISDRGLRHGLLFDKL
ncbi:hypothetical protein MASR2M29_19420 [Spirochaetota bacterium]